MLGNYDDWRLRSPYEHGEIYGTQEGEIEPENDDTDPAAYELDDDADEHLRDD